MSLRNENTVIGNILEKREHEVRKVTSRLNCKERLYWHQFIVSWLVNYFDFKKIPLCLEDLNVPHQIARTKDEEILCFTVITATV